MRVLHPGFRSVEGGPDFRGAVLQIGEGQTCSGDVEVDVRSSGWRAHGHDINPAFEKVVLQVVWEGERSAAGQIPVLPLKDLLDAPLGELSVCLEVKRRKRCPPICAANVAARCSRCRKQMCRNCCTRLRKFGCKTKPHNFKRGRARPAGTRRFGKAYSVRLDTNIIFGPCNGSGSCAYVGAKREADILVLQARLLGISGLLPVELSRSHSITDKYVRRVWYVAVA